jgi:hypothetical protein
MILAFPETDTQIPATIVHPFQGRGAILELSTQGSACGATLG